MVSPRDQRLDDDDDEDDLPAPAPESPDIVTVTKALDDGRVALWDVHPFHPPSREYPQGGEVYLDQMYETAQVHRSPGVNQKLGENPPAIRIVSDAEASRLNRRFQRVRDQIEQRRQQIVADSTPPIADPGMVQRVLAALGATGAAAPAPAPAPTQPQSETVRSLSETHAIGAGETTGSGEPPREQSASSTANTPDDGAAANNASTTISATSPVNGEGKPNDGSASSDGDSKPSRPPRR